MSRSGYSEDNDGDWGVNLWAGAVASAIRGRRGQAFLRDLLAALDAMPVKRLIAEELVTASGEVCAIGSLGVRRGVDLSNTDPEDAESVGALFDISATLARQVVYENDEAGSHKQTREQRWARMRAWVAGQIKTQETNHG